MSVFKDNDIRGLYPDDWNEETAYRIGNSLASIIEGESIVIGRDGRDSSEEILIKLTEGLTKSGISVTDIGIVDTPAVYFSIGHYQFDGGLMITASHNPVGYNGIKITGKDCKPIESSSGLKKLEELVDNFQENVSSTEGHVGFLDIQEDYAHYIQSFQNNRNPLKVVFDCSNGSAGRFIHAILASFSGDAVIINDDVDGSFPNHGPNPVLSENLMQLKQTVILSGADIGFCFDGDADRVVAVDGRGEVLSPDLLSVIIGQSYLKSHRKQTLDSPKLLVDIRSSNSVKEYFWRLGADVKTCPVGHARIKKMMREENALFAGELTGHYYYKENFYCDSAWITIFRILSVISENNQSVQEIAGNVFKYCFSGELNFSVDNASSVIKGLQSHFSDASISTLDGYRFDYPDWWFLIRESGTEPLVRLVAEAGSEDELTRNINTIKKFIV